MKYRIQHLKPILTITTIIFIVNFFIIVSQIPAKAAEPMVAASLHHTVGLKSDGTVVAVGPCVLSGECEVSSWTNIVQVAIGGDHTVGMKSDGTVVAVGNNNDGQCDVSSWSDIVQVAAGGTHTVGLKSDGTIIDVGGPGVSVSAGGGDGGGGGCFIATAAYG